MKPSENSGTDLLGILAVLRKWRTRLAVSTVAVLIGAVVFSILLPKKYKATALFFPPASSSGLSALIENFSVDILKNDEVTGEMCLSILNSRGARTALIQKYDLMRQYRKKYMEHALKALEKNLVIETEKQVGIGTSSITSISIGVIDKQPGRAADMANDLMKIMENKIIELSILKARNNKEFLGKRVAENARDLEKAENALKAFQEKYGAIEITAQAQAAIETAAKLKAELIRARTVREALILNLGDQNAQVAKAQAQIDAIEKEYDQLHDGFNERADGRDVMMPIRQLPGLGMQYFRLLRDVKVQNKLCEMLIPLHEQAKIQEEKDVPVIRVIDYAEPPTYKYKPKRAVIVLGILAVYLAFFMLTVFYAEYMANLRVKNPEQYARIRKLLQVR